jgi:hypothetical protein
MNLGILMTAFNRPEYQRQVLESWTKVRGFYDTPVLVQLEPSSRQEEVLELVESLHHPKLVVHTNPQILGPLKNPWLGLESLFQANFDFAINADDDCLVSEDILEFFLWTADRYAAEPTVAGVSGFQANAAAASEQYVVDPQAGFHSWVWGTWRDRWQSLISPTWDHDYSTFNDRPGNNSGFDWNLKTRVLPANHLDWVRPLASRVDNIGIHGAHGTAENHEKTASFVWDRPQSIYTEVEHNG